MTPTQLAEANVQSFDQQQAEEFTERVADTLNSAAVALMLSVGHRTGLLDTLARTQASNVAQIAEASGLSARYVREWLAVMVVGRIVHYDAGAETYWLPPEHAACLTRGAAYGNLAIYAQFIAMCGAVEPQIVERFRTGGGIPYEAYPCFHQVMAEDSGQTVVDSLFDTILPMADGLVDRLEAGIDALDAGCGRGRALLAMARRFPNSRFTGYDLCADAIEYAQAAAREEKLTNIHFRQLDMTDFAEVARYDFITTFDAVHDQKDPQALLFGLYRALKPGGVYLMQDIAASARLENNMDFPMAAFLYTASCTHCMPVSLAQGGKGLGTMWGHETAATMLGEAGFTLVSRTVFPHDPMNVWFVNRRD